MAALPVGEAWKKGEAEDLSVIPNCLCPACGSSNAVTTMLPTKIPLFREIYIMYLQCDDCHFRNSEVNFGGEICEQGRRLEFTLTNEEDLNRQLIKSDSATLLIPAVELEIPPHTQRGTITTIEGFLTTAATNLERDQPERLRMGDLDNFYRCQEVIGKLRNMAAGRNVEEEEDDGAEKEASVFPFVIVLDDPAGNSFIENPNAPTPDPRLIESRYDRTPSQDMALGLQPSTQAREDGNIVDSNPSHKNKMNAPSPNVPVDTTTNNNNDSNQQLSPGTLSSSLGRQEVLSFPTPCPGCGRPTETSMCVADIPHFKEIVLMSLLCEHCGYRSNEIKGGGAIPPYGTTITVRVTSADDLQREVLKSDTAGLRIPELELELAEGGLDGLYTTVEGMLQKLHERLTTANPFGTGDAASQQHRDNDAENGAFSRPTAQQEKYRAFLEKLRAMSEGQHLPFTLVIVDPLSNSFVGPVPGDAMALSLQAEREDSRACYDAYVDKGMTMEEFERTQQQNDDLGLSDMKTENYQEEHDGENDHNQQHPENGNQHYYGTDTFQPLPDRLARMDHRGPDHPFPVAMAPVEGDTTVMGPGSQVHATPGLQQRGANKVKTKSEDEEEEETTYHDHDHDEGLVFEPSEEYTGSRDNRVFRTGSRGLGYYEDKTL